VASLLGYRALTRTIQGRLLAALGPQAVVESIQVGLRDVTVKNLRIKGKGGPDPLSVERIVVTPSLRSLFTGQIRLSEIELDRLATVVHLRPRGNVELPLPLPAPDQAAGAKGQPAQVAISQLRLNDGQIDLVDHTVPGPPVRLRLDKVQASVGELAVPLASGRSPLEFEAKILGKKIEGRVQLSGWVEPITEDASVKATLRSVDMTLLSPYLLKVHEAKVERGQLNMDLDFQVRKRRINAPGKATFVDLQLSSTPGALNSFMGLPRQGVLNLLKTKEGKIEIAFVVEGDLNDPQFTLQRSFVTAMTMGLAERLGVSVEGVGSGVVVLGKRGAESVGGAAEQLGGSLKRLFEKGKQR
ncbi:MAG: DUF748 domain-containing protein, partial [Acidobacteria bacterium]|nr:DUF748 domain-containing protein [Acidobacteriota bacterium]